MPRSALPTRPARSASISGTTRAKRHSAGPFISPSISVKTCFRSLERGGDWNPAWPDRLAAHVGFHAVQKITHHLQIALGFLEMGRMRAFFKQDPLGTG